MKCFKIEKVKTGIVSCLFFPALAMFSVACSSDKEKECVDPPGTEGKVQKVTRTHLGTNNRPADPNADWCRACVMGPKGWASCQIAYATKMGEDRAQIKERSRQKACLDAGFKKGECPESALKDITCKGDPTPEGADKMGEALQKIFLKAREKGENKESASAPKDGDSKK